jgi:hypothetical protein
MFRKLAGDARPLDVVYHALDAAARFTEADHSLTLLELGPRTAVLAEKICGGRRKSRRIGSAVAAEKPPPAAGLSRWALRVDVPCQGGLRAMLVVRARGGDPFDAGDREALDVLLEPLGLAASRL